jgi:hypothetical protein
LNSLLSPSANWRRAPETGRPRNLRRVYQSAWIIVTIAVVLIQLEGS